MLNTNHLSFIYSFLLSLAFLLLIHCFRHTNATLLIFNGVSITTVQKLLGHKNVRTTQVYTNIMDMTIVQDLEKSWRK